MPAVVGTLAALLTAAAILYVGSGLQSTLLAVRGAAEGFSLSAIGLLMSAYYVGFIGGCRVAPRLVRNVGHIRTFTALASVASAAVLAHSLWVDPQAWFFLRMITGFCFAGLAMIIESWINEKATNDSRGKILSIYRIVDLSSLTMGQLLLTVATPMNFTLFALSSILVSIALVPVALTTAMAPQPIQSAQLNLRALWDVSPLAAFGCFAVGLANTGFWGLGPVFVAKLGYGTQLVAIFMSAVIVAGAVSQWPLGALSDRLDRRRVIVFTSFLAACAGCVLMVAAEMSPALMLAGAALFGFFSMPLFGLCVAHANDHTGDSSFVEINGGLLLLYGLGAVAGPIFATWVMELAGTATLFGYTMAVHVILGVFGLYRMLRPGATVIEDAAPYVPVPRTTPVIFELDPRTEATEDRDADA